MRVHWYLQLGACVFAWVQTGRGEGCCCRRRRGREESSCGRRRRGTEESTRGVCVCVRVCSEAQKKELEVGTQALVTAAALKKICKFLIFMPRAAFELPYFPPSLLFSLSSVCTHTHTHTHTHTAGGGGAQEGRGGCSQAGGGVRGSDERGRKASTRGTSV
jgi:hypothetical protein